MGARTTATTAITASSQTNIHNVYGFLNQKGLFITQIQSKSQPSSASSPPLESFFFIFFFSFPNVRILRHNRKHNVEKTTNRTLHPPEHTCGNVLSLLFCTTKINKQPNGKSAKFLKKRFVRSIQYIVWNQYSVLSVALNRIQLKIIGCACAG